MNATISTLLEGKAPNLFTVPASATVHAAVKRMIDEKVGSVLVVDDGRLVGIFTERDVLVRVVGANRNPMTTPVSFVMTHNPVSIDSSTTVQEVLDAHGGKEFRHLPVIDDGHLIGMISFRDILRWIAQGTNTPAV